MVVLAAAVLTGDGQPQPAPSASSPESATQTVSQSQDEVVVTGTLPEVSSDIDRKVYSVRNDAIAQGVPILEVLGRLPSVTVTPSGNVLLLGNGGVRILIDGRPPINPNALKNLLGAQVDRIEVMTNPSAAHGAEGTAGIINIITRAPNGPRLSGAVVFGVDSQGGGRVNASPALNLGRWTLDGSLAWNRDQSRADNIDRRSFTATGAEITNKERFNPLGTDISGSAKVSYSPTPSQTFSLALEGSNDRFNSHTFGRVTGSSPSFENYSELLKSLGPSRSGRVVGDYEWTGHREDESLSLSASLDTSRADTQQVVADDFDDAALPDVTFRTRYLSKDRGDNFMLDYNRPFGDAVHLETGASWDRSDQSLRTSQETLGGSPPAPDFTDNISGVRDIAAAYFTVQFPFRSWTVKPGIRVEDQTFNVDSSAPSATNHDFNIFPSLFLERRFSEALKLNLSYSRRISRPSLQILDPVVTFGNGNSAHTGNPNLRPEITSAYEAQLNYTRDRRTFGLTIYDRETEGVFSPFTELTTGDVLLSTTTNAGHSTSRGAEISWRAPLSQRWRYVLTTNLFQNRRDVLLGALTRERSLFSYTGNAEVDYSGATTNGHEGDQAQFAVRYFGRRQLLQGATQSFVRADLTWRHPLTSRLAAVLNVTDIFHTSRSESRIETPDVVDETISREAGPVAKLTLSYRLNDSR